MEIATILWSFFAAIAFMLAVACGLVWVTEPQNRASLALFLFGLATAASTLLELGMMHSATAAEYGVWLRWYYLPVYLAFIAILLFVHSYLGTARWWLMWAVIFARSVVTAVNFAVHPNFGFTNIVSLREVSLFGQPVSAIGVAVPRSDWQLFAIASLILMVAFLVDASVQRWRKGGRDARRRALVVGLGVTAPMLVTFVYVQMTVFGALRAPVSNVPWFLGALMAMVYELGRDVIRTRRERLELAELRAQLARVERVGLLGQLASNLAHELAQPLAATIINVESARLHLRGENPGLEELDITLGEIGRDNRRAAEIVAGMRQLLKQRSIELLPLRVEEFLEDAVSLVGPEAKSKYIALHLFTHPGLPRVRGDRVHLVQVLLNLLINSIHAIESQPAGARKIVVEARTGAKGEVEIAVRDSGPGIPDDIADKLFTAFFTTKPEGMGVGLALSRSIIEAHGGRLWAEPAGQHDGAIFRFTLRASVEAEAEVEIDLVSNGNLSIVANASGIQ